MGAPVELHHRTSLKLRGVYHAVMPSSERSPVAATPPPQHGPQSYARCRFPHVHASDILQHRLSLAPVHLSSQPRPPSCASTHPDSQPCLPSPHPSSGRHIMQRRRRQPGGTACPRPAQLTTKLRTPELHSYCPCTIVSLRSPKPTRCDWPPTFQLSALICIRATVATLNLDSCSG
jgi:hypothetical protein